MSGYLWFYLRSSRRESILFSHSLPGSNHRRFSPWVGSYPTITQGVGNLVQDRIIDAYQFPRTPSSLSCSEEVGGSGIRSVSSDSVRQYHGSVVLPFPGRDSLPISLSTGDGDLEVVFTEKNAFSAVHIPGEDNLVADVLSRGKFLLSE